MSKPSIGRIVVYNHPGSADGKFKALQSPGIVQKVNEDGTVEMVVFSVYGGLFFNHNVKQGKEAGQWDWPERVEEKVHVHKPRLVSQNPATMTVLLICECGEKVEVPESASTNRNVKLEGWDVSRR